MTPETNALARRFEQAFAPLVAGEGLGHGGVRLCSGPEDAATWIAAELRAQGTRRALAAYRPEIDRVVRLIGADLARGDAHSSAPGPVGVSSAAQFELQWVDPASPPAVAMVAACDAGIGGADVLIAETASVLLLRSPREPRTLSLLPRIHVVIAPVDTLVPRLSDALKQVPAGTDFVLITGASRTADVEKTLVVPAHGPGWLYVALLG